MASRCLGVNLPKAMYGRLQLYDRIQRLGYSRTSASVSNPHCALTLTAAIGSGVSHRASGTRYGHKACPDVDLP